MKKKKKKKTHKDTSRTIHRTKATGAAEDERRERHRNTERGREGESRYRKKAFA